MPRPFADHFGGHGDAYAAARPTYPEALYAWVAEQSPAHDAAWDCGTGNGQAALGLADHFQHVYATDPSAGQLAAASPHPRVSYSQAPAERSGLPDASVDVITVAEALHWFDHPAFFDEVRRVLRPGGAVIAWGYRAHTVSPAVDAIVDDFRAEVDAHFPPGREHLDAGYTTVPQPFTPIAPPNLAIQHRWTVDDMLAYFGTWSAVKRRIASGAPDPVAAREAALRAAWGPDVRTITWPLVWWTGRP